MKSTTYISLDLQRPNYVTVYAVQNDLATRWARCLITDGGAAWTPPSPCYVMLRYKRPDGVCGFYDTLEDEVTPAWTVNLDGSIDIAWAQTALQVAGTEEVEINFYNGSAEKLTVCQFRLQIIPSAYDDAAIVDSEPYINVLSQQIAAVLEYAADLTGISATASGLPAGSLPTVSVSGGTGGNPYVLAFGIPKGDKGDTGATGPTGNNWPVGSYYWTSDADFVPGTVFGGTWERVKDKFVWAAGDSDTIGDTGGAKSRDLRDEDVYAGIGFPDATHLALDTPDGTELDPALEFTPTHGTTIATLAYESTSSRAARLGGTLDTMPPYVVAYCWHRTA